MDVKIFDLTEETAAAAEELFIRYCRELELDEHMDARLNEQVLREKIFRGLFLQKWREGAVSVALTETAGALSGFAIYQIDSPASDWNRRAGWGFIREFWIDPACRGQGQGRALAEYAARQMFARTDRLYLTGDPDALGFWAACGFRETGEIDPNDNTA